MKKLSLLLLAGIIFIPGVANAQDNDWEKGVQLDAMIQPSKKELRKHRKKMMVEREVDSLIVSQDFKFEPVQMHTLIQPLNEFKNEIYKFQERDCKIPTICQTDYIRIHNGWFETKLFHEWYPLDDHRIYGLSRRNPEQLAKVFQMEFSLPPIAHAFKFTESVKEEDKAWFITIEVDRMSQKLKYEFVVQPTGWTVLRCTSNRWGNSVIYTGWLVRT